MRVLIFNTGNLADVMQMLPAFTDAKYSHANMVFDVIVDERWAEVPQWHPAVGHVFTIPSHSWQRGFISLFASEDVKRLKKQLRKYSYDWVIDLYGGWSSAWFARTVQCACAGFSKVDQKKRSSSVLYNHRQPEAQNLHRVEQIRRLLAHCLHYAVPKSANPKNASGQIDVDYGIEPSRFCAQSASQQAITLMLGAKETRLRLDVEHAKQLVQRLCAMGRPVRLLWRDRVSGDYLRSLAEGTDAELMPNLKISGIASVLMDSCSVVSVDNGLSHMAAALKVPMVRLHSEHTPDCKTAYGGQQLVLAQTDNQCPPAQLLSALERLMATMPAVANELYQKPEAAGVSRVY
ncbi:glycosyltransferase family 9 protein [Halioxenophilus aromaticivorans]|uniref:Lipopolysaccharide heptosyltransferase I n=1 Tax=Halioxenophilus aromaticivorans TaxID=1306992 RepID=A0AAV3U1P1_9ALTE